MDSNKQDSKDRHDEHSDEDSCSYEDWHGMQQMPYMSSPSHMHCPYMNMCCPYMSGMGMNREDEEDDEDISRQRPRRRRRRRRRRPFFPYFNPYFFPFYGHDHDHDHYYGSEDYD